MRGIQTERVRERERRKQRNREWDRQTETETKENRERENTEEQRMRDRQTEREDRVTENERQTSQRWKQEKESWPEKGKLTWSTLSRKDQGRNLTWRKINERKKTKITWQIPNCHEGKLRKRKKTQRVGWKIKTRSNFYFIFRTLRLNNNTPEFKMNCKRNDNKRKNKGKKKLSM